MLPDDYFVRVNADDAGNWDCETCGRPNTTPVSDLPAQVDCMTCGETHYAICVATEVVTSANDREWFEPCARSDDGSHDYDPLPAAYKHKSGVYVASICRRCGLYR